MQMVEIPMAIALAYEKKIGKRSAFYPYVSQLPEEPRSLVFKSDEQINEIIRKLGAWPACPCELWSGWGSSCSANI